MEWSGDAMKVKRGKELYQSETRKAAEGTGEDLEGPEPELL
jgi:hypothetical protein